MSEDSVRSFRRLREILGNSSNRERLITDYSRDTREREKERDQLYIYHTTIVYIYESRESPSLPVCTLHILSSRGKFRQ